jgi:16S rRNA (guanine966-N2)-methyltransferase
VTRIVGGRAKGRRLAVPARGTRPTSERAREALFNSLRSLVQLPGAHVLDLFAGSGAVGIEALSRGAAFALLVESDRAACAVLRRNLAAVTDGRATVCCRPVAVQLAQLHPSAPFRLVFADPPYALPDDELAATLRPLAGGWLAEDAVVVVERPVRAAEPGWPAGVALVMQRRYGDAVLWYGARDE